MTYYTVNKTVQTSYLKCKKSFWVYLKIFWTAIEKFIYQVKAKMQYQKKKQKDELDFLHYDYNITNYIKNFFFTCWALHKKN